MKIGARKRLLFIGDSVTDVGRVQPIAEGLFNPLGQGYPAIINGFLTAVYPERMIHVINMGTSGNTVRDLKNRWQRDVLDLSPDWVSLMIGFNDVWRQFDSPTMPRAAVGLEEYAATLEELVSATLPRLEGMVLMSPYYLEANEADLMRARMDQYRAVCADIASRYPVIYIDTQKVMLELIQSCHSSYFSWDRVHPNFPGHCALARAFLKAIDFKF